MARLVRADLVDPHQVAVFHCLNRCVRRGFLCGVDPYTGRNYDHRKQWLAERLEWLAAHFGIDLIGFSVMSNHFHLVLRSRPDVVAEWDDTEVARRWRMLCPLRKDEQGNPQEPSEAELDTIRNCPERLAAIRTRLSDISWWMRMACEPVARRANREDDVTGRFWEGRYKCVKLCDEAALLACLAYVDLNPIRAGIAPTPEASDYTSVQRRIESASGKPDRDVFLSPLTIDESRDGPLASAKGKRAERQGLPADHGGRLPGTGGLDRQAVGTWQAGQDSKPFAANPRADRYRSGAVGRGRRPVRPPVPPRGRPLAIGRRHAPLRQPSRQLPLGPLRTVAAQRKQRQPSVSDFSARRYALRATLPRAEPTRPTNARPASTSRQATSESRATLLMPPATDGWPRSLCVVRLIQRGILFNQERSCQRGLSGPSRY